jgi:hypothetical protein
MAKDYKKALEEAKEIVDGAAQLTKEPGENGPSRKEILVALEELKNHVTKVVDRLRN